MGKLTYQCCFCNERITPSQVDVTALIVISNWDKDPDVQKEQQLFCHCDCLKGVLANNVPCVIDVCD